MMLASSAEVVSPALGYVAIVISMKLWKQFNHGQTINILLRLGLRLEMKGILQEHIMETGKGIYR
jgi:hypothetical protein